MAALSESTLWKSLEREELRFVTLDESDCVFLERTADRPSLSADAVRSLSQIEPLVTEESVCLINGQGRIHDLFDFGNLGGIQLKDYSLIHAVGFASRLTQRMGTWQRVSRMSHGLWQVKLEPTLPPADVFWRQLELLLLRPWLAHLTPERTNDPIRNAIVIRERLLSTVRLIDAGEWAKWRGIKSKNPSAALGKYKRQRRVFAVRSGNRDLYPAFQFADNAEPLPIIEDILTTVPGDAQGWPLLSWFEAKNVLLENRKPSEVLTSDPVAVRNAAARFYGRDD